MESMMTDSGKNQVLAQLDHERQYLARDHEKLERTAFTTRLCREDGSNRSVSHSSLEEENADDVILAEVEFHRSLGVDFEWKLYSHDKPADLRTRLQTHGFTVEEKETVMVLDLQNTTPRIDVPLHRVIRIGAEDLAIFRKLAEQIFKRDYTFTARQLGASLHTGSTLLGYLAYVAGEPAGVGRLYTHQKSAFGGLYGGGTLPQHRGKGVYRSLVAARAHDAKALGARYLIVDALDTSRPILERMGFEAIAETWPCEWVFDHFEHSASDSA